MNKLIDSIITSLNQISKEIRLFLLSFYNKIYVLINKNFTLSKIYKPIIDEKVAINKNLNKTLKTLDHKNKETENNILKLENENVLIQTEITIIQDLLTRRYE
ncbi:MAG TPA: hypothetical protein VIM70_22405 [Clostridium sp.]|uniref:hypothetical protein n=1 Tax=Clostridium sp. TaxID=1506 RepID=UPI002F93613C